MMRKVLSHYLCRSPAVVTVGSTVASTIQKMSKSSACIDRQLTSLTQVVGYSFCRSLKQPNNAYEQMKRISEIEKKFQEAVNAKDYKLCADLLKEKVSIKNQSSTPSTSLIGDYRVLGEIQQHLGNGPEALLSFEGAWKLSIKIQAKELQALSLADMAGVHYLSQNYGQAAGYYEESVELLKEIREGKPDKDIALALLNLGECLVKNGDGRKAITTYSEAKKSIATLLEDKANDEETVFEQTRNMGLVCDALGSLKLQTGAVQESLDELSTALGIYTQQFGSEDPILVGTLTNLGILYQSIKQEEDALKLYKRAMMIAETHKDRVPMHETFSLMLGCAKAYHNLNRYSEAMEMFDKLEVASKALNKDNTSIIPMVKGQKGYLLIQMGEFVRAKQEVNEGLAVLAGQPFSIYKAILQTQLAYVLLHSDKQYEEALKLAEQSYFYISSLNKEDPNCGDCLRIMGLASRQLGKEDQAKAYLKKSLDILLLSADRAEDAKKVKSELEIS